MEIERKLQPILERGLKGELPEGVIAVLEEYKADVDKFYIEERKGIYQKYAFAPCAELSDKFETEAELYKLSLKFQAGLQKVPADILTGFAELKLKNYDKYLSDAEAYSERQKQREKDYNRLVFKMRQDLAGQEAK